MIKWTKATSLVWALISQHKFGVSVNGGLEVTHVVYGTANAAEQKNADQTNKYSAYTRPKMVANFSFC